MEDDAKTADTQQGQAQQKRARSQIDFPYSDMESAEGLTGTLYAKGGGSADPSQLAGWLDMSSNGGTFRSRVSAARMYGFVETARGSIEITDLGRRVVDPQSDRRARADAFLNVPLYEAMFEKNKGYALPPAAAIERQMVELGVPVKQKERARQVFQKSAERAGFIDGNSGRFIKPAFSEVQRREDIPPSPPPGDVGGNGGGGGDYHPFIQGLLDELPDTDSFANWSINDQAEWLRTAAGIFKLMSKQRGRIEIEIKDVSPDHRAGASRVTGGSDDPSETA